MARRIETDICVIGAGSGGLTVAVGAARMGAETVLVERGPMGGDCLNAGCVPSKAMIAAARAAEGVRRARAFGVDGGEPAIDFARANDHVLGAIAAIRPMDSQERMEGLGIRVVRESARFTGPDEVRAGDLAIRARRFVVATGSRPAIPPIPGLTEVPFLTNETVFGNRTRPAHLGIIGAGPIGAELAQAHARLGSRVTVMDKAALLSREDPELSHVVRVALLRDGIDLRENARIVRVERSGAGIVVVLRDGEGERPIAVTHLLVATGRQPNIEDLDLAVAGIEHSERGIRVDAGLRTTNRRVFAVGDVVGGPQFTHLASHHAAVVLRRILFRLPARVREDIVPSVTYTDPEIARVGLTEAEARERFRDVRVLRWRFDETDRGRTDRQTEGLVKVVTRGRGRILGAGIVGPQAGELIHLWCLALSEGLGIGAVAGMVAPYPTLGEASRRAAGEYFAPILFGRWTRRFTGFLRRFG